MRIDPDGFAAQLNYLAAIGRMIVPRVFAFAGQKVLFVGHVPFIAEELGNLLPEESEWHEHPDAPSDFVPSLVILGRAEYAKEDLRSLLRGIEGAPKVLPQEGFVDELIFGHDWWDEEIASLRMMTDQHRGLQIARSVGLLAPVGIGPPAVTARTVAPRRSSMPPQSRPREKPRTEAPPGTFSRPTAEAMETKRAGDELDLRARSRLNELGYNTNQSRPVRWRVLTEYAVPELGLPKVANMIAWLCRTRKQQKGGREKYAHAIGEWKHDLAGLHKERYPGHRPRFVWPRQAP